MPSTPKAASLAAGDRPPVVLQVLPALLTGGVERGTIDVAGAIKAAGWTSLVVSSGGHMVRELDRMGVNHIPLPVHSKNPLVMRANISRLEELIRDHNVDIVHARSRAPAWSAFFAAQRSGRHFLTTFHGTYNLGLFGLKNAYNAIMTRGERVIAISHFIADHMQTVYGIDAGRIRVIHRGIDLERFDPARVSPERIIQLAQRWRLPDGYPVIMLPGRLTRWKGQTVLIEALALLGRRDLRCLLVGADQGRTAYAQELKTLAAARGLAEVVHIVGDCNDMPAAYMLTDVVVSASTDPEAFGRVIVEAQAMGRSVVATDNGAGRENVMDGQTGLLVPPGDAGALALAIDRVLAIAAEERAARAALAIDFVRRNFSRELMCERTLGVYAEVLGLDPAKAVAP
ncbi:MAG TPA: glycosyltransferase family 4 protein [Rhodospirillaceae bacterium]|nr:glycosyltransferase family 4 protein [Rhodospirillaceae bacterium]